MHSYILVIFQQTDDELTTCDSKQEPNQNKQDLISEIVQDSLSRLHVVYCHASSDNLNLIFQNVETRILSKQLSLDAVIIENVLNYYFEGTVSWLKPEQKIVKVQFQWVPNSV